MTKLKMCPDYGRECLGSKCVAFSGFARTNISSDSFREEVDDILLIDSPFPISISFKINYCTKYDMYVDDEESEEMEKRIGEDFIPWNSNAELEID